MIPEQMNLMSLFILMKQKQSSATSLLLNPEPMNLTSWFFLENKKHTAQPM